MDRAHEWRWLLRRVARLVDRRRSPDRVVCRCQRATAYNARRSTGGNSLQQILKEISAAIGLADTIELTRRWGGRTLAVPMKVDMIHPLAMTLGLETAQKLVKHFGGVRLQLPAERNALLDMRNAAIYRACTVDGRSQESVGLEYGLTRQGVAAALKKVADTQPIAAP